MTGPGETAVEGIGETTKPPTVCREGVGIRAVVQGIGEGRGGGRRSKVEEYKFLKPSGGGAPYSTGTPT